MSAALPMTMFFGSSSRWPPVPTLTFPRSARRRSSAEEISTDPPPEAPRASMPPRKVVSASDHTIAVPPRPPCELTSIRVASLIKVARALASAPLSAQRPRKLS